MPVRETTVGRMLVDDALPAELRGKYPVLDKKNIADLLSEVAQRYPDRYREISFNLSQLGRRFAYETAGNVFRPDDLQKSELAKRVQGVLQAKIDKLLDDDSLDDDDRERRIIQLTAKARQEINSGLVEEGRRNNNPLAWQVISGARGNPANLARLIAGDMLYNDAQGRILPIPVTRSYAQGLTPLEYFAGSFGARAGLVAVKFQTGKAGYLSKQLNRATHRLLVTDFDRDGEPDSLIGLPVSTDDEDSEGSLLALPVGGYPRNTVLTPRILHELRDKGINDILVRSPAVSGSPEGGLYARDVGIREQGRFPDRHTNIGLLASQALSEPLSQSQLSAKHTGGVAGESKGVTGFDAINAQVNIPKTLKGAAAHAQEDGVISKIEPAPTGGAYIWVNGTKHYASDDVVPLVKIGQKVEAGDQLTDGLPSPAVIVQHQGIGEGRRRFMQSMKQVLRDAGINAHRRNLEVLARGLLNHVRLTEEAGDFVPGDIVPYSMFEHSYRPRLGSQPFPVKQAMGRYLERPYLHYTIGTKVRPRMVQELQKFGIDSVVANDEPPPFEPEMVRGAEVLLTDPDWMTQQYGSSLQRALLKSTHRGATSDVSGTSFVPALAKGLGFGQTGLVRPPKPFESRRSM